MNIISTWIYLDRVGEESNFPQVRGRSSSEAFQNVYWKCVVVFFETSLRYNQGKKHILFTNTERIPTVDGFDIGRYLAEHNIEVVQVENEFKVPPGYFGSWNNQFFEFSIIKYLSGYLNADDGLLLLDSDCVFNRNVDHLFQALQESKAEGFTYLMDYSESYDINGLSRLQMKSIFKDLGLDLSDPPHYSGGEVMLVKGDFIKKVSADFEDLWQELMSRYQKNDIKFNEEAHVLSYYYYKYNTELGKLNQNIKRCWTDPFSYRNIEKGDSELDILHLPAEKKVGMKTLFNQINKGKRLTDLSEVQYRRLIHQLLSPTKHYGEVLRKSVKKIFSSSYF